MEALLAEDALEDDHKTFDSAVRILTLRDYDYLDFRCVLGNSIFVYANIIFISSCNICPFLFTAKIGISRA